MELRDYAGALDFLEEEKLAANSLSVDIIVRKKTPEAVIGKNIARIFRAFNIAGYKSPADTFTVKDFYKVHSYTTLFVSSRRDAEISGVTMSLVSAGRPRKLLEYLDGIYNVSRSESGIYQVEGDIFPVQVIVTRELDEGENFILNALNRNIGAEKLKKVLLINDLNKDLLNGYVKVILKENARALEEINMMTDEELYEMIKSGVTGQRIFADGVAYARTQMQAGQTRAIQELQRQNQAIQQQCQALQEEVRQLKAAR